MFTTLLGASVLSITLLAGWTPFHEEVPAPVPQPGPGPTVPPKPSDPIPTPPPKPLPFTTGSSSSASPYLMADIPHHQGEAVSGTLMKLDLAEREGRLATDVGRQVAFHIPKPKLFVHLSVGQRVTVKLDNIQQAIGVMETTTPELRAPQPAK